MTKVAGIEFVPLNIPLERRLQTLAVSFWCTVILFFSFGGLVILLALLFTRFYYVSVIYFIWLIYDHKKCQQGGRR